MKLSDAFLCELEKISAVRWAREIAKGNLSAASLGRLRELRLPTRQIKALGAGGEQVADLVFHPTHGLSVRKVPLTWSRDPRELADRSTEAARRMSLWKDTDKYPGFAKMLGSEGSVSYHEHVPPGVKELGPRLDRIFDTLGPLIKKREKQFRTLRNEYEVSKSEKVDKKLDELVEAMRRNDVRRGKLMGLAMRRGVVPKETQLALTELKKKYPGLHDVRPANIHRGKIIDISPDVSVRTSYLVEGDPLRRLSMPDRSRKIWLGKGREESARSLPATPPVVKKEKRSRWPAVALVGGATTGLTAGAYGIHKAFDVLLHKKKEAK